MKIVLICLLLFCLSFDHVDIDSVDFCEMAIQGYDDNKNEQIDNNEIVNAVEDWVEGLLSNKELICLAEDYFDGQPMY